MSTSSGTFRAREIRIPIGGGTLLDAQLTTPPLARGVIVFAHPSGSSRHDGGNRSIASELNFLQFATVLADLLTPIEAELDERSGAFRFDITLLTRRVMKIIDWTQTLDGLELLPIGLFGESTGAPAALDAATLRPERVRAIVCRGGRTDLAVHLRRVQVPTLLVAGEGDAGVLRINDAALTVLQCQSRLEVIPGATHAFEEPGALEAVASAAGAWFERWLSHARA